MLEKMVLPNDLRKAESLYNCCYSCLNRARLELYRGNLDEAERWVEEFQRCKRDLDRLIEKKSQRDKIRKLVTDLNQKGIDVVVIKNSLLGTVSR